MPKSQATISISALISIPSEDNKWIPVAAINDGIIIELDGYNTQDLSKQVMEKIEQWKQSLTTQ